MKEPTDKQKHSWRFGVGYYMVRREHIWDSADEYTHRVVALKRNGWLLANGETVPYRLTQLWCHGVPSERQWKAEKRRKRKLKND